MTDVDIAIGHARLAGAEMARAAAERVEVELAADLLIEQLVAVFEECPNLDSIVCERSDEGAGVDLYPRHTEDDGTVVAPDEVAEMMLADILPWNFEACVCAAGYFGHEAKLPDQRVRLDRARIEQRPRVKWDPRR